MNFLPLKKYEIDTTGTNQDNRVMEERHLISPSYNVIIPVHAPFFQESLVVMYNGTRLTPNVDYQFDDLDVKATQASNKSVYTTIVLKRQDIQGEVWLNYQTYGDSNYAGVVAKYIELIMKDNRKVDWNEVFNKPAAYPPIYHKHHVRDIRGIWPIVVELQGIKQAIEYLRYKGNVKLKGEIFTHIAALNEKFDRFRSIVEQSINLEEMKREIINNLSAIIGTTVTNFVQSLDVQKLKDILIFFQGEGVSQISKDGVEHIFSFDGPNRPAGRDKIEEIKRVFESVSLTTTSFDSFLDTLDNRAYFTLYSRFRQFDREGYTKCFTQEIRFVVRQNLKELHVSATRFVTISESDNGSTPWEVAILRNDIEAEKEKETFKTEVVTQAATAAKADFTKELDKRLESLTINWNNVTNKPSFDTSWNAIADKPNFYPTRWDMISSLPDFTRYALKETLLSNNSLTSADYTKRVVSEHYIDTPVDADNLFAYPLNINRVYRTINRVDGLPALGTSTKVIPFGTTQKSHQHMVIDPTNNHIFFRGMGNSLVGLKVDWNDIENKPSKFSVNWNDIQGKPTDLVSGSVSWDNIQGKPTTFPVSWNDIQGKPTNLGIENLIWSNLKGRPVVTTSDTNVASQTTGEYVFSLRSELGQGETADSPAKPTLSFSIDKETNELGWYGDDRSTSRFGKFKVDWENVINKPNAIQGGMYASRIFNPSGNGASFVFPGSENISENSPIRFSTMRLADNGTLTFDNFDGHGATRDVAVEWSNVLNKPILFDGEWSNLKNKPTNFPTNWKSIQDKPISSYRGSISGVGCQIIKFNNEHDSFKFFYSTSDNTISVGVENHGTDIIELGNLSPLKVGWNDVIAKPKWVTYPFEEFFKGQNFGTLGDGNGKQNVFQTVLDGSFDLKRAREETIYMNAAFSSGIDSYKGTKQLRGNTFLMNLGGQGYSNTQTHKVAFEPSNAKIYFTSDDNDLRPLKVDWADVLNKPEPTTPTIRWDDVQNKPTSFPADWYSITGRPNLNYYVTKHEIVQGGTIISEDYKARAVNEIMVEKPRAADKLFEEGTNSNQVFKEITYVKGFPVFGRNVLVMPVGTVQRNANRIIIDSDYRRIFFRGSENRIEPLKVDWANIENIPANLRSSGSSGPNTLVYKTPETVMRNGHPQHMITLSELFSDNIGEQRHFRMLATTNDRMTKTGVGFWLKDCFLPLTIGARVPELCHVRTTRLGNEVDWAYVMEVDAFTTIVDRQPGTTGQRAPQWYNANFVLYLRNPKQTFGSRYTDKGVEVTSRLTSTYAGGEFMIREVIHLFATTGSYGRTDRTYEEELLKTMERLTW